MKGSRFEKKPKKKMSGEIIEQITYLFGLMGAGYLCNKCGILNSDVNSKFSGFLLKAALPATILCSAFEQKPMQAGRVFYTALITVGVFAVLTAVSAWTAKMFHLAPTYQLMMNYSNLGFMGLPIAGSLYGSEGIFYVVIFMMVFNVHIFTFGIMTLCGKQESFRSLWKKLCTPGIVSALLAFIIVLGHVRIPAPAFRILEGVSTVTTPLAMMVIGSQLAECRFRTVFAKPALYLMALFKLVLCPLAVGVLLRLMVRERMLIEIAAILTGLPVAGNVTMLCSEYNGDVSLAAQGVCMTTLFSLITIPCLLAFL